MPETRWCEQCHRVRSVIDSDTDVTFEGAIGFTTEVEWKWVAMDCGHEDSWQTGKRSSWVDG